MLRILWSSNSPFCSTGYGTQTATASHYLTKMGHEIAIFAFYGLEGSKVDWGEIPIYPNDPRDWGQTQSYMFYEDFKADIYLTLVDVWVQRGLDARMNWVPWMPVDHNPIPPLVVRTLRESPGLVKPIAMTKYGQSQLAQNSIEAHYIPHSVDTTLFRPEPEWVKETRSAYNWQDKFVIGCVATNHSERKNWTVSMKAVKKMKELHPNEIIFYMHTNPGDQRGINLAALREHLGLNDVCFSPSMAQQFTGIDRETMARTYNVMDVFLLPTKGEGFGIPLVEAQACGIPIITTKCTGHEELMGGGWFIENLNPIWTGQASWQFDCTEEEVVERLEQAYQAKKNGSIEEKKKLAREKALEYEDAKIYGEIWGPVLKDIEDRIKRPKSLEGVQNWRLGFIPQNCVPRKVLDIGCGITQPYRPHLEHLGDYVGIDIKKAPGVTKMNAQNLKFGDGEFGFVWMSEVLEHIEKPEKAIAEAKRVGKHGVCLFSTPMNPFFKMDPEHKVVKGIPYNTIQSGDGLIVW